MDLCINSKKNDFTMPMFYQELSLNQRLGPSETRFCFVFIENGSGIIKINDKSVIFNGPAIFCLNDQEFISSVENCTLRAKVIFFHPSILNAVFNFENIRKLPTEFTVSMIQDHFWLKPFLERNDKFIGKYNIGPFTAKRIKNLFVNFNNVISEQIDENWPCRSRSYLMELLFLLGNIEFDQEVQSETFIYKEDEEISEVLLYLVNNYNKKITISDLTTEFNINRTTLAEKFYKVVGESIISYLNKLRIRMASLILRETGLPISEVMNRVGFNESTHFFRTFKKYMGMSPKEYRAKNC